MDDAQTFRQVDQVVFVLVRRVGRRLSENTRARLAALGETRPRAYTPWPLPV